jgi:hypothetical protein
LTTERSPLASKILELAANRTAKSAPKASAQNQLDLNSLSQEAYVKQISESRDKINLMSGVLKESLDGNNAKKLSQSEVDRTRQMLQKDINQYNSDIKLLSLLIGKPVTEQDLSKLAATNLGLTVRGNSIRSVSASTTTKTTTTERTTPKITQTYLLTSTVPAFKPLSDREAQFLQALEQIQTTSTSTTTSTTTEKPLTVSKSQEAILAAILKQQGIGPNSQIPIEVMNYM